MSCRSLYSVLTCNWRAWALGSEAAVEPRTQGSDVPTVGGIDQAAR